LKPRMAATQAMFQSTLPRGERHSLPHVLNLTLKFQSTLPRGERRRTGRRRKSWTCFNPRSRGGSDTLSHTSLISLLSFNPRSRGGSDFYSIVEKQRAGLFQSTLPRGERRRKHPGRWGQKSFNPRSRGGSDHVGFGYPEINQVSIHAPAGGATSNGRNHFPPRKCFNPRSRGGSDPSPTRP